MGQYYKAVNLDKQEFVTANDYGSGVKLMEHSWILNPMVNAIVVALSPAGAWYRSRIVWAGDYMDEKIFMKGIKGKTKKDRTLYDCCHYSEDDPSSCITQVRLTLSDGPAAVYIVNHEKRQFVKLADLPEEFPSDPGWHLHPLPLLTCSGNGRGGGDFGGDDCLVGTWAGHCISSEYSAPKGYRQIIPDFTERER